MIKAILWDVDGTLLDFKKSERYGICACLEEIGVTHCDDAMLERYAHINRQHWEALERGELTKQEVLLGRFHTFFRQEGICCPDIAAFNASYQEKLGSVFFENEASLALLKKLHSRVRQYVVTNGTAQAQHAKLAFSGIEEQIDGVFISDEIGAEKPDPLFFAPVLEALGSIKKEETLIVGDSLTSDMRGGKNMGFICCWYNPSGGENKTEVTPDYEIRRLWEVEQLLGGQDPLTE